MGNFVLLTVVAFLASLTLWGCGSGDNPGGCTPLKDEYEDGEVDLLGGYEKFTVGLYMVKCEEVTDWGLHDGSDEPLVKMSCGSATGQWQQDDVEEGDGFKQTQFGLKTEECLNHNLIDLVCNNGDDVQIDFTERDGGMNGDDTGSATVKWDAIQFFWHGWKYEAKIKPEGNGLWDSLWDAFWEISGGICLTDMIPGTRFASKLFSPRTVKFIKKLNDGKQKIKMVKKTLEKCDGEVACGNALDVINTIWDKQCMGPNGGGSYLLRLRFGATADSLNLSPRSTLPNLLCIMIGSAIMTWLQG